MNVNFKNRGVIFQDGKLQDFTQKQVQFNFEKKEVVYNAIVGGQEVKFTNFDIELYGSVDSYKKGVRLQNCTLENIDKELYKLVDGKIVETRLSKETVVWDNKKNSYIYPSGVYETREELIFFEGFEYVPESGNVRMEGGKGKDIFLNEEQSKLVEEMRDLLSRMQEHDMRLIYSIGSDNLMFLSNKNNVLEYMDFMYEDETGNVGCVKVTDVACRNAIHANVWVMQDELDIYVK